MSAGQTDKTETAVVPLAVLTQLAEELRREEQSAGSAHGEDTEWLDGREGAFAYAAELVEDAITRARQETGRE